MNQTEPEYFANEWAIMAIWEQQMGNRDNMWPTNRHYGNMIEVTIKKMAIVMIIVTITVRKTLVLTL